MSHRLAGLFLGLALLVPALAAAKRKSLWTVCTGNQRQIGVAYAMYASDHEESYPLHSNWADFGGRTGTSPHYGATVQARYRPLNAYAPALEVFASSKHLSDVAA